MRCLCSLVNCEFLKKTNRQRYCTHSETKGCFTRGELRNPWHQDAVKDRLMMNVPTDGIAKLILERCPHASTFKQIIAVERL